MTQCEECSAIYFTADVPVTEVYIPSSMPALSSTGGCCYQYMQPVEQPGVCGVDHFRSSLAWFLLSR